MVQAGRVQLERPLFERLPQTERPRADGREAQVVNLFAPFSLEKHRLAEAERSEDAAVEQERLA